MKRLVFGIIAAAVLVPMPRTAMAQSKTVSSEMKTATGTIEAVEAATRTISIKKSDGTYTTIVAGPDITRFAEVKVGQKVNVRYYENVIVRVKQPGEPDTDTKAMATTGSEQAMPGGTKAKQRTITATITAIDPNVPSVTFTGPNGWKVQLQGAGQGSSLQGEGRRQGRLRLDRSNDGVARARHVGAWVAAGAVRRVDRPGPSFSSAGTDGCGPPQPLLVFR